MWVRFTRDFDWRVPGKPVTIAYKAGMVCNVTRACAVEAKNRRAAVALPRKYIPKAEQE